MWWYLVVVVMVLVMSVCAGNVSIEADWRDNKGSTHAARPSTTCLIEMCLCVCVCVVVVAVVVVVVVRCGGGCGDNYIQNQNTKHKTQQHKNTQNTKLLSGTVNPHLCFSIFQEP